MSSPFQKAFTAKRGKLMAMPVSEIKPAGIITDPVIDDGKSASSNKKPLALTPGAAQGGTDYEAQLAASKAKNPEGQGGKDYEAED